MDRGEVWWADLPLPVGRRPVLIVTRSAAVGVRNQVVVAQVTRTAHGLPCEVALTTGQPFSFNSRRTVGPQEGLRGATIYQGVALRWVNDWAFGPEEGTSLIDEQLRILPRSPAGPKR